MATNRDTIDIFSSDGIHRTVIEPLGDYSRVTFYEDMSGTRSEARWVRLGTPELWSNSLVDEEILG